MSALLLSLLNDIDDYEPPAIRPYYDFGYGVNPHHIHRSGNIGSNQPAMIRVLSRLGDRQSRRSVDKKKDSTQNVGKDGFQVCMDVSQFKPNELSVKVVEDHIVVEGRHEEREDDHGPIYRHFVRRYALPDQYDADKVVSTLSSDGVLTVSIPKPQIEDKSSERVIQIQQTGPAHLNVKENQQEKKENGGAGEK